MSGKHVYDDEVAEMLELAERGDSVREIAKYMRRDPGTVAKHLSAFKSTGVVARRYYEAQQLELARRVVATANVEQILEIQDRLDVLPKKDRNASQGPQVLVCVGMPGQPALPVPTVTVPALPASTTPVPVPAEAPRKRERS
jgi:hypothetical protein